MPSYHLIDQEKELEAVCEEIRQEEWIAFDTEFIRESTFYPQLEIIQIATQEKTWLIDAKSFQREEKRKSFESFLSILSSEKGPIKVLHASQADQECMYHAFGTLLTPVFDTAIASSLLGYGDGVGLANLLSAALNVKIKKGHARTNWSERPLPNQLLDYAAQDVVYLVELAKKLAENLDEMGRRDWAFELSSVYAHKELYEPDPLGIAKKLASGSRVDARHYGVLLRLTKWREARIRELNVPRKWLADDGVLLDLSRVCPKDAKHLLSFRGLNRGEAKQRGERILKEIQAGLKEQPAELANDKKKRRSPSAEETRSVELFRCFLGILAQQNNIASRYLVPSVHLLDLVRSRGEATDWIKKGWMSQGAYSLVGEDLKLFLSGSLALRLSSDTKARACVECFDVGD